MRLSVTLLNPAQLNKDHVIIINDDRSLGACTMCIIFHSKLN